MQKLTKFKGDTGPQSTWASGTIKLRTPKLAKPGQMVPRPKKVKSALIRPTKELASGVRPAKAKTVSLSTLVRPKRMKL